MNKRIELSRFWKNQRRLFIVDIENAVGNGAINDASCTQVRGRIETVYNLNDGDFVVIGVSHSGNVYPAASWKGARLVFKRGHSGADRALEKVLENERIEDRFGEVIIVSGDGLFADQASRLTSFGIKVTVDSCPRRLSKQLASTCSVIRFVPETFAA